MTGSSAGKYPLEPWPDSVWPPEPEAAPPPREATPLPDRTVRLELGPPDPDELVRVIARRIKDTESWQRIYVPVALREFIDTGD
jgi:hypothetical protein